jgi:uracil-DNA glycosylase
VDGKDRLRRYLEQRRETGERDLVLDSMTVAEVMRLVGLPPADATVPADDGLDPGPASGMRGNRPPPASVAEASDSSDWRAVLRGADRDVPVPRATESTPPQRMVPPFQPPSVPTRAPDAEAEVPAGLPSSTDGRRSPDESAAPPLWLAGISVGQPSSDLFAGPLGVYDSVDALAGAISTCTRCSLYATATRAVPGEGAATASMVCVGEAPGATEDATGRPFVGQAGKLLDKILAAIALRREDVFICNVLKHRPPGNRNPLPTEVAACSPFLVRQLELIRPRVIVAFGTFASQTLLQTTQPIGKLRGAVHRYYGVPLIVTYHPAALLRNPAWKRPTWEDVQYARRILGIGTPTAIDGRPIRKMPSRQFWRR